MGPRPTGRCRVRLLVAEALVRAALCALGALLALGASPAFAAGTLTSVTWTPSNLQNSATNVTYVFSFKTATAGTIASVTMTVPNGTAGTIAVGTVYGLGAGTVALASNTITYTVTTPVSVATGVPIYLSFTGLTNRVTAGGVTSTVTTRTSTPSTIDSGTSGTVTFGSSSTTAPVTMSQSLTSTCDISSFSLTVDPTGLGGGSTSVVTLSVLTNASTGYTLSASDSGLSRSSPAYTIPDITSGPGTGVGTFPSSGFGCSATFTTGGTDGAALAAGLTGSMFVGYPSSPATFFSATGPTGTTADTLVVTNQVAVSYAVPAGAYTDTITYVLTPTF